jgi:hypothetical protein
LSIRGVIKKFIPQEIAGEAQEALHPPNYALHAEILDLKKKHDEI